MDAPTKRPSTATGLRLGGLNTTTPSVGELAETRIVTLLPLATVEEIKQTALTVFEGTYIGTWLIDATHCRGIKPDAVSSFGSLVARTKDLGCRQIILVVPKDPPSEEALDFRLTFAEIAAVSRIQLDIFASRTEAGVFVTEQRWRKLKEAQ